MMKHIFHEKDIHYHLALFMRKDLVEHSREFESQSPYGMFKVNNKDSRVTTSFCSNVDRVP